MFLKKISRCLSPAKFLSNVCKIVSSKFPAKSPCKTVFSRNFRTFWKIFGPSENFPSCRSSIHAIPGFFGLSENIKTVRFPSRSVRTYPKIFGNVRKFRGSYILTRGLLSLSLFLTFSQRVWLPPLPTGDPILRRPPAAPLLSNIVGARLGHLLGLALSIFTVFFKCSSCSWGICPKIKSFDSSTFILWFPLVEMFP